MPQLLIRPAEGVLDWTGTIDYLVHHVHQVDIDKQDPRYVLVYDVPATDAPQANDPLWNSHDARDGKVTVAPAGVQPAPVVLHRPRHLRISGEYSGQPQSNSSLRTELIGLKAHKRRCQRD